MNKQINKGDLGCVTWVIKPSWHGILLTLWLNNTCGPQFKMEAFLGENDFAHPVH